MSTKYSNINKLLKTIKKLSNDELTTVILKAKKQKQLLNNNDYMKSIPNIFKDQIKSIIFLKNYDSELDNIDDFSRIECDGKIKFNNGLTIMSSTKYMLHRDNDDEIDLGFLYNKKYYVISHNLYHGCDEIDLEFDKKALLLLDILEMEINSLNKKMLAVLLNNFIAMTDNICCPDSYDGISQFNCKKIESNKKNNKDNNNIYYSDGDITKFKFI
ncbi:hypothetical protein [Acanthamoeba polyphaga mimivirus]|uniref:Uncharacterized protein n=1 Tax=Acanthamoeba polyphaga mimivirus TaxID=212035 RepID=A0A2L2DHW7_MIMIV|nr:hypothetical protein [Acanthamoeba polyphaga mimivirus]